MKLGIAFHATDLAMPVPELARECEARGFHSLYIPEHTHIPSSRETPPPTGEAELAEQYYRSPDPYIALAGAATVTTKLVLGTGVGLPAQHDTLAFAKQLATLDRLSGGRFEFGIGYGWNREEMRNHGIDYATRRELVREVILAMKELWTQEIAEYQGQFVRFEPSFSWPKPARPGGPPILLGGAPGPKLFAAIAEYGDGWMPIGGTGIRQALPALREAFEKRGRNPASAQIIPFGTLPDRGKLDYYAGLGIDHVVLRAPTAPRDEVLPVLDAHAKFL
jgi:probable F420-dependent oxidoreductase